MANTTRPTCTADACTKPAKVRDRFCSMHRARLTRHGSVNGKAQRKSLAERILSKVEQGPGCWKWNGYINSDGYAVLRSQGGNLKVHRFMLSLALGRDLAPGLFVDHACRNRACINPDHLREVTPQQNVEHFTSDVRADNTSGYRGVTFHRASGLWKASVGHKGREYSAGYYRTAHEAGAAALDKRLELHTYNDLDRLARTG